MKQPNWFDKKYDTTMERASAENCLAEMAKDSRITQAVKDALSAHDTNSKTPGWVGPSRTQTVRDAVVQALEAMT